MSRPSIIVQRIHFEDFDGKQFERLVFAFHLRYERWKSLEWYGQSGSDLGRDIWGIRISDSSKNESICIQCANHRTFPYTKAIRDINEILNGPNGIPDTFRFVCASAVSAGVRDKIKIHASESGISDCDIWSGEEFEERLRLCGESLLKRFTEGITFPDAPADLRKFTEQTAPLDDREILGLFARVLDRPAFTTPFHSESSLPAFKQAITDTIEVLNTGIWRTRDGIEITRIPSRHMLTNSTLRSSIETIQHGLVRLRGRFDELMTSGAIKHCGCAQPECPVYSLSPSAEREMDELRSRILSQFHKLYPEFGVSVGWLD